MAIRVPINPQTRYPGGALGYGQNHDVSSGTRALAQVVGAYSEELAREEKKRELFDVQKLLVDETNALQTDFEERRTAEKEPGAPNFTRNINDAYTARHSALVEQARQSGFSEDALNEFATRLGTIRGQYVAKAIDFQDKAHYAKVLTDTDDMATSLSQYTNTNPGALPSALSEWDTAISNSGLDQIEAAQVKEKGRNVILRGAQEGFAVQHPEKVLELYGMPNELHTATNETTGELVNLGQAQKTVADTFKTAGWNGNVIAGFLGNFHIEDGYTGKKGDGGKAKGIAQWRDERVDNFKALFGKEPQEASIAEQAKFVIWEMQNPAKAGMSIKQRDAILAAKSPEEAARLIDNYYERSDKSAQQKRVDAAMRFVGKHADATVQALTEPALTPDARGHTGIAVLDMSTGPERMRMLQVARTIMNKREADQNAQDKLAHDKALNDLYNGIADGKLGQADINAAYSNGLLNDFDERKKAQDIFDSKNKKDDDLVRFNMMLDSGQKFNPYSKDAQDAVDAGFEKAVEIDAKGQDPEGRAGPFRIALRAWERTGILPTEGGVMIRGALIGTDPTRVAAAASVASNMLKQNPNAFAGVEGEEDIGKAAANYAHYVDDLGMTAHDAANKIATQNSPEFQAKAKADEKDRTAFAKKLNEGNIEYALNNAIGGKPSIGDRMFLGAFSDRGKFASTEQKAEARQTYLELALDHYDKYHDEGAATAYASRQMGRFYGVEGGKLIKFPPSKAYPEIMGSRDYIYDQAKTFVDKQAGFAIPKEDITLVPTASGSTAAAFRQGKPAPYEVHYVTRQDGQVIYHVIPGQVFIASVEEARVEAQKKARAFEKRRREKFVMPGIGEVP